MKGEPERPVTPSNLASPFYALPLRGPALSDLGYRGKRLAKIAEALGITVKPVARGRDGKFLPAGICWVVERSFAWLSRYRRVETNPSRAQKNPRPFI